MKLFLWLGSQQTGDLEADLVGCGFGFRTAFFHVSIPTTPEPEGKAAPHLFAFVSHSLN